MEITIKKLTPQEVKAKGISSWPIWEKEVSRFNWQYEETEECYILEGKVVVSNQHGQQVEFTRGDFVSFPKGLSCIWDIKEPVKKHYNFR